MSVLKQILESENIEITSKQLIQLEKFTGLLQEWNKIHNLTGAKTLQDIYPNIVLHPKYINDIFSYRSTRPNTEKQTVLANNNKWLALNPDNTFGKYDKTQTVHFI